MKRVSKMLYEKRGSKYIPVGKDDFIMPYGVGDYLIRVRKGSTKMSSRVIPLTIDWAKVEIAMDEAADAIADAMREASKLEIQATPLTAKEKRAWKAYQKICGAENLTMTRKSACDIAHASVKCLREGLMGKSECPEGCFDVYAERSAGVKT